MRYLQRLDPDGHAASQAPAQASVTLGAVQRALARLEREQGLLVARRFARSLDYDHLTLLARLSAPVGGPGSVDPRYLLLWGSRGPAVERLQYALRQLGHPCPHDGLFDDATLTAYLAWLAAVEPSRAR